MATGLENLKVYQIAEELELKVFELLKIYPNEEKFLTVDQIKRSSSSVSNNIAEGYNRYSFKEKIRSLVIAKGEAEETKMNLLKSGKKGFITNKEAKELADKYTELLKAISGYIRFLKDLENQKLSNLQTNNLVN